MNQQKLCESIQSVINLLIDLSHIAVCWAVVVFICQAMLARGWV